MLLAQSFVPVVQITSNIPRSNFSEQKIQLYAQLILESEGTIKPLVLRSLNLESYEVIDGHLEYYAAARAREIDLKKGEMIGAFVIEIKDEKEDAIKKQIKLLRNSQSTSHPDPKSSESENIHEIKTSLQSFQSQIESLVNQVDRLNKLNTPKDIRDTLKQQLEILDAESQQRTKEEALKLLWKTQADLKQHETAINERIFELTKINLLTTSKDELERAIKQLGANKTAIDASWKALEYWRKLDRQLTWDNLKKSVDNKSEHNIPDFGKSGYEKLTKIGYL